jgi:hypothetical protein
MQNKIIRTITRCNNRASCRNLFGKLETLPLASQYILSLMLFMVNTKNLFISNSGKHDINTRQSNHFYKPISNFMVYRKGVHCMGIRVYNKLPTHIKEESHNPRKFKTHLKQFLHIHYFYSIEEYFQYRAGISINQAALLKILTYLCHLGVISHGLLSGYLTSSC